MLPTFPDSFKLVASVHQEALDYLRTVKDVDWVYLSPAADFQAEGARTGSYLAGGEDYFVNDKGASAISYADYAIAMVDEVVSPKHHQERFSVIGKYFRILEIGVDDSFLFGEEKKNVRRLSH